MTSPVLSRVVDSPATLPMLATLPAVPIETMIDRINVCGLQHTTIARLWADRTTVTCGGLCGEECTFKRGMCMVAVDRFVPDESCAAFAV